MSQVTRCDYEDCTSVDLVAFSLEEHSAGPRSDFCSPEHVVLYLFQHYPDMPLWYGPKRDMETASAKD